MSSLPSVSIIVLNWNSQSLLEDCLHALQQLDYPSYSITIVDNASSDDSISYLESHFPAITRIENFRNLGYGGGNNVALRQSQAEIAVLINPDVVAEQNWLRALIEPMVRDPSIGIAGCKLLYPDSKTIQHAGGFITSPQAFPGHFGLQEEDQGQCDEQRDVDYVIGAAIALRRSMLDQIGYFDEGFFLYFEEADLCRRARDAGFRVVYVPESVAIHIEAATTEKESAFYLRQIHSGRWRYLLKHATTRELLDQTFPAEADWLRDRSAREWQALGIAYRNALRQMPEIWRTRRAEAMDVDPIPTTFPTTIPTKEEEQAIDAGVAELAEITRTLYNRAHTRSSDALNEANYVRWSESDTLLQTKSYVVEQPFTSSVPFFGPLLARVRTFWNNIATTWYVRPLTQQQNEYNYQVLERLRELRAFQIEMYEIVNETHNLLNDLSGWWIEADRDTTRLAQQSGEFAYRLIQLEDRLSASASPIADQVDSPCNDDDLDGSSQENATDEQGG